MESTGERLKKLRLAKGLSLEEVQKRTKIHLNVLRALEEDRLVNFNPIYTKGFIKIYCKFLGADPKDYIQDYRAPAGGVTADASAKDSAALFKTISVGLDNLKGARGTKIKQAAVIAFALIVLAAGLFSLGRGIFLKRASSPKKKVSPASTSARAKPQAKPEKAYSEKIKTTGPIRLDIRAKEDCWVFLKADGKLVFQGILKKGRSEAWQAKDKIEISLGNAGVVDFEVNGKLISNLGKRGQVLKNVLITKEGLTIPR